MDAFFDAVTILFLVLTAIALVILIGVISGAFEPPLFAPAATAVPATVLAPPTLTPSPVPAIAATPTGEPVE